MNKLILWLKNKCWHKWEFLEEDTYGAWIDKCYKCNNTRYVSRHRVF